MDNKKGKWLDRPPNNNLFQKCPQERSLEIILELQTKKDVQEVPLQPQFNAT
jgi:hypothetical protein